MAELSDLALSSELQAYYKLENLTDEEGGTSLTNNNSVTFTTGKFGDGASFGIGNTNKTLSLSATPTSALQLANVSYTFWFKILETLESGEVYVLFENSTSDSTNGMGPFLQYRNDSGTKKLRGGHILTTTNPIHTYDVNLTNDTWYHLGLSIEGTTTSKIFLNGVKVSETTGSGSHTNAASPSLGNFTLAANRSGNDPSSIMIDDFGIIERVLTDAEWLSIYEDAVVSRRIFNIS